MYEVEGATKINVADEKGVRLEIAKRVGASN